MEEICVYDGGKLEMHKYYILSVDSFQDTFTRIDAIETFSFTFLIQNKEHVMDAVMPEEPGF